MVDAFISYRRKPSAALSQLIQEKLKNHHHIDAYVDTTRTDSSRVQFPERLMTAIADAPIFICLLGEGTLESEWVHKEIERAYELQKYCIPVFQESYTSPDSTDSAIEYLLRFDAVHVFDIKSVFVDESIAQIAALCATAKPSDPPPRIPKWIFVGFTILLVVGLAALAIPLLNGSTSTPTAVAQVDVTTPPPSENSNAIPTPSPTMTPTPYVHDLTATAIGLLRAGANIETQVWLDITLTALAFTSIPTATLTATVTPSITPNATGTYEALLATIVEMEAALAAARKFDGSNEDWQALYPEGFEYAFEDDVPMMLVPAGSFLIGAAPQTDDEHFGVLTRFDQPFWIDRTEVTQADFDRLGGVKAQPNRFVGDQRPVEQITWFEARDFCASRGARLPTEAEWEYAARGPAEWDYPWGYVWNPRKATWNSGGTLTVGSWPTGRSWVGALDMSGNVWEWVSSLYQPYPYNSNDENISDIDTRRVLRGGGWSNQSTDILRSGYRSSYSPGSTSVVISLGFRCARSS